MKPYFDETLHDATEAIDRIIDLGGGPLRLGFRIGTSAQTIYNIKKARRVTNAVLAHLMADVATEKGETEGDRAITSRVLAGMDKWATGDATASEPVPVRRRKSAPAQNRTGTSVPAEARPAGLTASPPVQRLVGTHAVGY